MKFSLSILRGIPLLAAANSSVPSQAGTKVPKITVDFSPSGSDQGELVPMGTPPGFKYWR